MHQFLFTITLLLALQSAHSEDLLTSMRLYSPASGPLPVVLALRGFESVPTNGFQLLLLDGEGGVIDSTESLVPGRFNLLEKLPAISDLHTAARVQVIVEGRAIGTPLVVQPLRTPTKVRTTWSIRPNSTAGYTRVIGFNDEVLLEEDGELLEQLKERDDWDKTEEAMTSGFRMYVDREVLFETDHGPIRMSLAPEHAPNTAWNFHHLVEGGFYDETIVHRVVHFDRNGNRFVIQGGDPSGTGEGSAGWDLPMERSDLAHDLGVVSMARADSPHSAGSQWFICLGREGTARLDGQYVAFGWVTEGAKPIALMADSEIADASTGRPVTPPVVLHAHLIPAPPQIPGAPRSEQRIKTWWTEKSQVTPVRRDR